MIYLLWLSFLILVFIKGGVRVIDGALQPLNMAVDRMQWGAEEWQFADLHMPDDPSPYQNDAGIPCVMLIHGGFWKQSWTSELMKPVAQDLADAGVAAWNIEFKGWSDGDEGVWMDTLSDVLRAWGQLALLPGIDTQRSMVMGHSAGGHLALLLAANAESKPWLVIAQAPITDLIGADHAKISDEGDAVRRWIGCSPEENPMLWTQLNPIDHPPVVPVLLIHGERDTDVPKEQSETYARIMSAKGIDVQKLWLPGDHYSVIDVASDDWLVELDAILDWL
ncbi:MAG: dipeptidyl aminopeptidase/acylaminoacyl peptidase [Candidatus Poseidoniaceae archaeon]|jgi:dipeptidyl aminopeptidase/acylaminoacyl peptidase